MPKFKFKLHSRIGDAIQQILLPEYPVLFIESYSAIKTAFSSIPVRGEKCARPMEIKYLGVYYSSSLFQIRMKSIP